MINVPCLLDIIFRLFRQTHIWLLFNDHWLSALYPEVSNHRSGKSSFVSKALFSTQSNDGTSSVKLYISSCCLGFGVANTKDIANPDDLNAPKYAIIGFDERASFEKLIVRLRITFFPNLKWTSWALRVNEVLKSKKRFLGVSTWKTHLSLSKHFFHF